MISLTVLSVIENDPGLTELMVKSVIKNTPEAKFIFCDNTNGGNVERIKSCFGNKKNLTIVKHKPQISGGSNRHGSGLNRIFPLVDTKYVAVVENDVVVLDAQWCNIKSGCLAKASFKQGKKNTYHMCFYVAETLSLWKNNTVSVNFMPGGKKGRKPTKSGQNYEWDNDVGWRIAEFIGADKVDPVDFIDCKSGNGQYFGAEFQSDEFHYNGKCIAAHLGRGSNIGGKSVKKHFDHPTEQLKKWRQIAIRLIEEV